MKFPKDNPLAKEAAPGTKPNSAPTHNKKAAY